MEISKRLSRMLYEVDGAYEQACQIVRKPITVQEMTLSLTANENDFVASSHETAMSTVLQQQSKEHITKIHHLEVQLSEMQQRLKRAEETAKKATEQRDQMMKLDRQYKEIQKTIAQQDSVIEQSKLIEDQYRELVVQDIELRRRLRERDEECNGLKHKNQQLEVELNALTADNLRARAAKQIQVEQPPKVVEKQEEVAQVIEIQKVTVAKAAEPVPIVLEKRPKNETLAYLESILGRKK